MRLWHEDLLPHLPKQWLQGQHRECCALRGKGWGKNHSVVNYVWEHPYSCLYRFHMIVINELIKLGVNIDITWTEIEYRGKLLGFTIPDNKESYRYPEHDEEYLNECLENLKKKGIDLNEFKNQSST